LDSANQQNKYDKFLLWAISKSFYQQVQHGPLHRGKLRKNNYTIQILGEKVQRRGTLFLIIANIWYLSCEIAAFKAFALSGLP